MRILALYILGLVLLPDPIKFMSAQEAYFLKAGAIESSKLKGFELWRLVAASFMARDLISLVVDITGVMVFGSIIEHIFGRKVLILQWASTSFVSGLLMVYYSQPLTVIVTLQFTLFGLLAVLFGVVILNWDYLGDNKIQMGCMLGLLTLMILMGAGKDLVGDMSALATGIAVSLYFIPLANEDDYQATCRTVGLVTSIALIVISIATLFLKP